MPTMTDFATWMQSSQTRTERTLEHLLPRADIAPQRLHEAMRYAVLGGGKRVRPLLAFAAGEVTRAAAERVQYVAAAIELIHTYSLAHDDLPAMDDDDLRRGKPTVHVEFDEATALLVGDALQSLAFETLATQHLSDDPAQQIEMLRLLASASGSRGMAGGQAIDLASVGHALELEELEFMHIHKTGALIRASVLLGASCGTLDDTTRKALDHSAKCIGLAFQVIDDVLDAEVSTATLGKTSGKDAANNKPTYVSLLGTARARELALELRADAQAALAGFGDEATRLRQLADFVVERGY
jgi:farnesyl diphosphate synthase